jgi:hypothetical protein
VEYIFTLRLAAFSALDLQIALTTDFDDIPNTSAAWSRTELTQLIDAAYHYPTNAGLDARYVTFGI